MRNGVSGSMVRPLRQLATVSALFARKLAKSEEAQDCDNDYDGTNNPNNSVHLFSSRPRRLAWWCSGNRKVPDIVPGHGETHANTTIFSAFRALRAQKTGRSRSSCGIFMNSPA
jgi:hypothetical protein